VDIAHDSSSQLSATPVDRSCPLIFTHCHRAAVNTSVNVKHFMAALWNRAGRYIFALWFLSSFFFFFSSPNLSGRRSDVYHTSTRGVVLVRIYNTDLKCAARGSLKMQDAKKLPKIRRLGTISQLCRAISSQLRHVSTIGKSLLNSNTSPICLHNMVNFGLLAAPQPISTGFASWQRYYTAR